MGADDRCGAGATDSVGAGVQENCGDEKPLCCEKAVLAVRENIGPKQMNLIKVFMIDFYER